MAERDPSDIVQLKVRMRENLRALLEQQAGLHRMSLNAVIVHRLYRSFTAESLGVDEYAPAHIRQAMQVFGRVLHSIEFVSGRKAFGPDGDDDLHRHAHHALNAWFEATRPGRKQPGSPFLSKDFGRQAMIDSMRTDEERRAARDRPPVEIADLSQFEVPPGEAEPVPRPRRKRKSRSGESK